MLRSVVLLLVVATLVAAQPTDRARLVIIADDVYVEELEPLAEWKMLKGIPTLLVRLSDIGRTPADVRAWLRDAWQNWPTPPAYVLLAAHPNQLPGRDYEDDCYYGDMTGDHLMEIPVGRFPAWSADECGTMVARTLAYERYPQSADTAWHRKGTTVVAEDRPPDPYYQADSRFARNLWQNAGYLERESLCDLAGHDWQNVTRALESGRTFIAYRGTGSGFWTHPFYEFLPPWRNRHRTPVIVSATCATVTLAPGEAMLGDLSLRDGSVDSLGGALAFFGTTRLGMEISAQRSACYRGLFAAIFSEGITRLGPATVRARFWVDSLFHDEQRYTEWCLLGDPSLDLWTAVPRPVAVVHNTAVEIGRSVLIVSVQSEGRPVRGAVVCASFWPEVHAVDTTDASGLVRLDIEPLTPGTLHVTATGSNLRPYEGTCRVTGSALPYVGYLRHSVLDSPPGGNGDGYVSPGETVTLPTWVRNYGGMPAGQVTGALFCGDSFVSVIDSLGVFGTIMPGDSARSPAGFRVQVGAACPSGRWLRLGVGCRDSTGRRWQSGFWLRVGTPDLEYVGLAIDDSTGNGNGRLDPRETARLCFTLDNRGFATARSIRLDFRSTDLRLEALDPFGTIESIPASRQASNTADPIVVRALPMVPGTFVPCTLRVDSPGQSLRVPILLQVGETGIQDPLPDGPRQPPLYWAFEDVDTAYPEHPTFEWVVPTGSRTRLELGDNQTATVDLPPGFGTFRFYDQEFAQLSVCSNGWASPGSTGYVGWSNQHLPYASAPALLAVDWVDLSPAAGGDIWFWHDPAFGRFVVEWDSVHYRIPSGYWEQFQLVIFDSTQAARDGNSEFVFQYASANNLFRGTVGIQDPSSSIGITVKHNLNYKPASAPITIRRAIKFTTDVPVPGIAGPKPNPVTALTRAWRPPTPVRNNLFVPGLTDSQAGLELIDAVGRRRLLLVPGENDLSRLAPGVYFLAQPGTNRTDKLILTR